MALIARAELPTRADGIPKKSGFARVLLEPAFQALGLTVNFIFRSLPADASLALQQRIYRALVGSNPSYPFADTDGALASAKRLRAELEEKTGSPPAIVALLAHAPIEKDLLYLNIELFRHSLWGIREVRESPCRPRLVNAMDAFALDMLPLHEEGAYAGLMSSLHLGFDRMPSLRAATGGMLLRHSRWPSMANRVRGHLSSGGEMIMVLAGGVETTARLFYALRESIGRFCRRAPRKGDARDLMERAPEPLVKWFARLTAERRILPDFAKSRWRLVEACVLYSAVADGGFDEAAAGRLPAAARETAAAAGAALGYGKEEIEAFVRGLADEFSRSTPYRSRFFRFLANAVVRPGRPILFLPLTLGDPGRIEIRWGQPAAFEAVSGSRVHPTVRLRGPEGTRERSIEDFAREFVSARFL
jgi:hypothetical protein